MKNKISIVGLCGLFLALSAIFAMNSCNKKFDEPATSIGKLDTNSTIKQLRGLNPSNGQFIEITSDIVIKGVVVGNDKSGNIYKTLYVQDNSAGIDVELDATGLFNLFPVGREVFIKCKGLFLANETGMLKLCVRSNINGTPAVSGIPSILIDKYIVRGELNQPVVPVVVTVAQLNNDYQSMLIQLNNYEVVNGDLNKTWADTSANKSSGNVTIKDCSPGGNNILIRSSGYSNFAGIRVPQGNGSVRAIYTVFNTTKQLVIRDTSDVQFSGPRCGAANPNLVVKTIQEIRGLYTTGAANIPANTGIEGIIVSNSANEASGNYRIQDASGYGIQIRFTTGGNPNAVIGDKYLVDVSGLTVDLFNGDMQINNVGASTKTGTGTVTPRVTTVSAINTNLAGSVSNNWSSTVVTLNNVTITQTSSNATGSNYDVKDGTGTIVSFVRNALGVTMPAFATSITGYVSLYLGTPQITIRSAADVVAGSSPLPVLTTSTASAITQTSASSGGNITSAGTSSVTARGVVWSIAPSPTVALSTKTTDGSGIGSFNSSITGLSAGTKYYVRAYATNSSGTAYGDEISFTTQAAGGASLITEDFETGTKSSYSAATVALSTGSWTFSDAVIGSSAGSDIFNGTQSARIRGTVGSNNGFIQTEFGIVGLQSVSLQHAMTNFSEPVGATASFELYISKDGGTTWTKNGSTVNSNKGAFATATFTINATAAENVRVRILNTSSANGSNHVRLSIDDVKFTKL